MIYPIWKQNLTELARRWRGEGFGLHSTNSITREAAEAFEDVVQKTHIKPMMSGGINIMVALNGKTILVEFTSEGKADVYILKEPLC